MNNKQKFALIGAAAVTIFVAGSVAQTTAMPAVDLSVGPLAVTTQAVNVALALSVEFPTAGAAYRTGTYDHTQEYLGYWDPKGCYQYGDVSDASALTGNYFRRVGSVDSDKYCSGGASYSGNVLNYAATSSIDLLRYALTGGNRVLDTANQTVLGRAFLPTNFNGIRNASYFPQKEVSSSLVGLVTPQFLTPGGTTNYTGTVYFNSCDDLLLVGNASTGGTCATPGSTNAFGPVVADTSSTYTEQGFTTPPTNTSTTVYVVDPAGKKEWRRAQPQATTTVMPSGSDPNAGTLVPEAVTPTPRNTTVVSTGSTPQRVGDPQVSTTYTPTGSLTTTVPPTGAPDTSPQGTRWDPNVPGADTNPSIAHNKAYGEGLLSELAAGSPQTAVHTQNHNVCRSGTTNIRLRLNSAGDNCNGTGGTTSSRNVTTYVMYTQKTLYKEYITTPVYNYYQEIPTWYEMSLYTIYRVYGTKQVRMKANVQVCDSTEASTRQDSGGVKLCKRYPDDTAGSGNYKPVGELQRKAEGVRVSAFGYAMEDGNGRYGGVLRAPMKFLGNKYRDTSGAIQSNPEAEWDANTGVFTANPLNDTTYGISGVANYLNKFGKTGKYKSNDPVGELYYEALRYFQGLQPTSTAVSSLSTAGYDGFPIYTSWTDPVQNACQRRNFILTIGDVNTHYDKQLPGHKSPTGVNETTTDPARAVEAIPGGSSSQTFSAVDWTKLLTGFETGTSVSYTDAQGRAQNTLGNPNVVANNTTLDTKATGSQSSAYYWAGAAYWANTQPIRRDTKTVDGNPQSMKDIRVKTFTIDVDEGGNGSIDANTRGIKPRNSSFFLAGKYGWFNDANEDGNPFRTSGGSVSNKEWEDPVAATIPDGYVLASQAQRMIAGIRKFFGAVSSQSGTISASAVSSQRFTARSPNGDFYSPSFNAGDWSGTVIKSGLQLNTTTNAIESLSTVTWDAGQILTAGSILASADTSADPYLKPAERKIFTFRRETNASPGIAFTSANLSQFDTVMRNALNKNPVDNSTDSLGEQRVDYLRGVRTQENATTNTFRRRASVMGDVINSGPVFKKEVDENIKGDSDYPAFVESVASRTAAVYVGANDGMLHALRASDGKELFAYVPLAVATTLNRLTNPSYQHTPYVDGVPAVGEAKIGTKWRTVLASGMGGGAQGVFALDVTDPDHFEDGSTGQSKVLFEFTDQDDPTMGNVLTQPQLVKVMIPPTTSGGSSTYKWFVAVSSGYNNYVNDGTGRYQSDGAQAIFFLSLDKTADAAWAEGSNYFKITVPANNTTTANGLANPGVLLGPQGEVKALYAGDLQGQVWKLDLSEGLNTQNITDGKILRGGTTPMFIATAPSGARQPITTPPLIANTGQGANMVVVGTGKFMEKTDADSTGVQSIYGIWDDNGTATSDFGLTRSALAVNGVSEGSSSVAITPPTDSYTLGRGSGQKRGWYFDLAASRERIAVEGAQGFSTITLNSTIPVGDCSGDGDGRSYTLNPITGIPALTVDLTTGGGMLGIPIYLSVELDGGNYSTRFTSGTRNYTSAERIISPTTKLTGANNIAKVKSSQLLQDTVRAGRVSWREVRDFKD